MRPEPTGAPSRPAWTTSGRKCSASPSASPASRVPPAPTDRLNPTSPRPRTPPQSTRMPLAAAVRSARCARPGRRSCLSNSFDSPAPLLPIIPLGKEAAGPLHFEEGRCAAVSASDEFQRECDLNHRAPLGGVRDCCAEFAVSSPYHFAPGPSLGGSGNSCRLAMTHAGNLGNGGLSDDRPGGRPGLREGTREGANAKAGISGQAGNTYRQSEGSVPDWRRGAGRASSADRTAGRAGRSNTPSRSGHSTQSTRSCGGSDSSRDSSSRLPSK